MSRRYVVSTSSSCPLSCAGCEFTGFLRPLPKTRIELKARGYTEQILPCHVISTSSSFRDLPPRSTLQFRSSLSSLLLAFLKALVKNERVLYFLWLSEGPFRFFLFKFLSRFKSGEIVLGLDLVPNSQGDQKLKFLRGHPIQVLFARPFESLDKKTLENFVAFFRKHSELDFRGLDGWDFHEPRCPSEVSREPESPILFQEMKSQRPTLSVIIPLYNDAQALKKSLHNWNQQSRFDFEVIVVDDGSDDQPFEKLQNFLRNLSYSLRWIQLPRTSPRQRGDLGFRAGVARNIGASYAQAENLVFVDSDIIVSPATVESVVASSQLGRLLQAKRWQILKSDEEESHFSGLSVNIRKDPQEYWDAFQLSVQDWNQTPFRWKYVSTFFLSLKKKDFEKLGWFRKNYIHYGCEDTDLGVRAHSADFDFCLLDLDVLHLPPAQDRSEYSGQSEKKKELLEKAFLQLYRNTCFEDVYAQFFKG